MQYGGGGGGHRFMKVFHKIPVFFEGWLPLVTMINARDANASENLSFAQLYAVYVVFITFCAVIL